MFRLSGIPGSKTTPSDRRPLWFTANEGATAMAIAQDYHDQGFRVRLMTYPACVVIFDSATVKPLEKLTIKELREKAERKGLKVPAKLLKAELVALIRKAA